MSTETYRSLHFEKNHNHITVFLEIFNICHTLLEISLRKISLPKNICSHNLKYAFRALNNLHDITEDF